MSSDTKKEDNLDQFWSYLNGDNVVNTEKQKNKNEQPQKEDFYSKSFYKEEKENTSKNEDIFPEGRKNINRIPQKSSPTEFNLSKALKAIEEIEAFGEPDDLSEAVNLSSISDSENEDIDSKKKYNNVEQADLWPSKNSDEEPIQDAYGSKKYEYKIEEEKKSAPAGKFALLTKAGSTLMCGGLVVAVLLSLRLVCVAISTVKTLMHYLVVC